MCVPWQKNLLLPIKTEAKEQGTIAVVWCTCSLSSVSCPDRFVTSLMVDSSFSCRFLISFCSPSPSLLTRDMARIRGNQSRLCSCGRPSISVSLWFRSVNVLLQGANKVWAMSTMLVNTIGGCCCLAIKSWRLNSKWYQSTTRNLHVWNYYCKNN